MINQQLLSPKSIVIVGGSNNVHKPGGKVLKNILEGGFSENLFVINPKEDEVQGIKSFRNVGELQNVDLAILAIPAKFCPQTIDFLAKNKNTRAFIILSAGFSEESKEGAELEKQIVEIVESVDGCLIGPNCIGVLTPSYNGVFTSPIPKLAPRGVDFISGSGATAVFIMESGIPKGLMFSTVYSVGNSAQIGVEEVLEYLDKTFEPEKSSKTKLLYIESITKPQKLLKHASSLIRKGCRIAAIKSGASEAGSRAASSHTGALASSDLAVDALFRKAGIVRCYGREDLITVAGIFQYPELQGKRIAVITHAGGPAVMLTDALSKGGLEIPPIEGEKANELLELLYSGSSVANPIDFLATGNAEQLGNIIDYCDKYFDNIDAMVVIFGTPGLVEVFDVYELLHEKMKTTKKPIYPVLPSTTTAKREVEHFLAKERINFPDEVLLGQALTKVFNTPKPIDEINEALLSEKVNVTEIRAIIASCENGYISPDKIQALLDAAQIPRAKEGTAKTEIEAVKLAETTAYPLVMKVVGPVHKTDVGGVVLNVKNEKQLKTEFNRMINIKDTTAILIQPMLSGTELFIGANYEPTFGHLVMCGLGGIFIEVIKDVASGLAPLTGGEALQMIQSLRSYKMFEGVRGKEGINANMFADIIVRLSAMLYFAPEIKELDLNPLLGTADKITVVDARIKIGK